MPVTKSSQQLKLLQQRQTLQSNINRLQRQLTPLALPPGPVTERHNSLKNEIKEMEEKIKLEEKKQIKWESLNQLLDKYKQQLNELQIDHTIGPQFQQLKLELETGEKEWSDRKYGYDMRKKREELELWKQKIAEHNLNVQTLEKLKLNATKVECQQLENTVANINNYGKIS